MSYKCGHCGGRHMRLESAQNCARDKYVAEGINASEYEPVKAGPPIAGVTRVPPGWYSFRQGEQARVVAEVRVPSSGRWKGRYFVNMWSDGVPKALFDKVERDLIINNLLTHDFGVYMMMFGRQTGICPVCEEELSEAERGDGVHVMNNKRCWLVPSGTIYRLEEVQDGDNGNEVGGQETRKEDHSEEANSSAGF